MDCCELVDEEVLVNVCLHGMLEEYRVFLEKFVFFLYEQVREKDIKD